MSRKFGLPLASTSLCPISGGIRRVTGLVLALTFAGSTPLLAQAQIGASRFYKTVHHGQRVKINGFMSVDPTCRSLGDEEINLIRPPQDGVVEITHGRDYPTFGQINVRAVCNRRLVPATQLFYHSNPASTFDGVDTFDVEVVFPNGTARKFRYAVVVH